jgi:hypothetical protein
MGWNIYVGQRLCINPDAESLDVVRSENAAFDFVIADGKELAQSTMFFLYSDLLQVSKPLLST